MNIPLSSYSEKEVEWPPAEGMAHSSLSVLLKQQLWGERETLRAMGIAGINVSTDCLGDAFIVLCLTGLPTHLILPTPYEQCYYLP